MAKVLGSTLSGRFVNAYNLLDHSLRVQYNFKSTITFTDLIRRTATLNQIIRLYEDDLIDLARLRNAIIHSRSEQVIAEPHQEVVLLIEKVARLVSTPPLVIDAIKGTNVDVLPHDATLRQFVLYSSKVGHSNIPVYKRDMLVGVLQRSYFLECLGSVITSGRTADEFLSNTTIEQYLKDFTQTCHFRIAPRTVTIEKVVDLFHDNWKLSSVIITDNGTSTGRLMGIATHADIINLMNILKGNLGEKHV